MQKRLFITLLLCFTSFAAFGQADDDKLVDEGSAYSQFGLGFPVDYGSSAADGMGLFGVSYSEPAVATMANPAHWGSTFYGMATGGIGLNTYRGEDNLGTARNSNFYIDQFQLQLPIYKNKFGISASFTPYTQTAFQVTETETRVIGDGSSRDTLDIISRNTGKGGVNRIEVGFGWNINSNIAVGYAPSLVFSSVDNSFRTSIVDSTADTGTGYAPVSFTEQTSGSGMGHRFGLLFTLPNVLNDSDQLSIGTTLSLPVTLDGERIQEGSSSSDDDVMLAEGDVKLPLGLTTGLTYKPGDKLALSTEVLYQKWSNFENGLNTNTEQVFKDRFKVGAGLSYFPFITGSDKFLSRFKYRFGASYDTGHLQLNGENINTIMLSAGLGLLSPSSTSTVDLSFEYGFRGTKSENLVKENIWGFKLSLNLAEIFFFRPKLQ